MEIDHPQNLEGIARMDAEAAGPSGQGAAQQRRKGVDPTVDGKAAPWVEKYRPKSLDDVAAHKEIIDTSARGRALAGVCLAPGRRSLQHSFRVAGLDHRPAGGRQQPCSHGSHGHSSSGLQPREVHASARRARPLLLC
jgi:hypothetical protein